MEIRDKVANILEEWYGTDAHCEGTWLEHTTGCANAILALFDEEREALEKKAETWREMNAGYRKQLVAAEAARRYPDLRMMVEALRGALAEARSMFYGGHPSYHGRSCRDFRVYEDHWKAWIAKTDAALNDAHGVTA